MMGKTGMVMVMLLLGCGGDHTGVSSVDVVDAGSDVPRERDTEVDDTGPVGAYCEPLLYDASALRPAGWTWPSTPESYIPEDLYYVSTLTFPLEPGSNTPSCCRDYGDASRNEGIDNSFALIEAAGRSLGIDFQGYFTRQLESGELVLLWDFRRGPDDSLVIAGLRGGFDANTDYDSASRGEGRFELEDASFASSTGEPTGIIWDAHIEPDGTFWAGPGSLYVRMPLYGVTVDILLEHVELEGQQTLSPEGVPILVGQMSATLELAKLYRAFNDFALSERCACLGISDPPYVYDAEAGTWSSTCVDDALDLCNTPENQDCAILTGTDLTRGPDPQICELAPPLFRGLVDVDVDCTTSPTEPGGFDALSLGFEFEAWPAE